jgi:hypothetical protein
VRGPSILRCVPSSARGWAAALVAALAVAAGCTAHSVVATPVPANAAPPATDRIRVMEPPDVVQGMATRLGSGNVIAVRTAEGFRLAGYRDVTVLHDSKEADARRAALAVHARFLAVPTVLEWVDRAPAFRPNHVQIRVDLHELGPPDRVVATATFTATSRRTLRKPGAARLLDEAFRRAVAGLAPPRADGH